MPRRKVWVKLLRLEAAGGDDGVDQLDRGRGQHAGVVVGGRPGGRGQTRLFAVVLVLKLALKVVFTEKGKS